MLRFDHCAFLSYYIIIYNLYSSFGRTYEHISLIKIHYNIIFMEVKAFGRKECCQDCLNRLIHIFPAFENNRHMY